MTDPTLEEIIEKYVNDVTFVTENGALAHPIDFAEGLAKRLQPFIAAEKRQVLEEVEKANIETIEKDIRGHVITYYSGEVQRKIDELKATLE